MPRARTPGLFFMKHPPLKIYDTTLRDGTQGEGISFSVTDKLLITERLDHFGVDYIEGGFPGSNPKDHEFFQKLQAGRLRPAAARRSGSSMASRFMWVA